MNRTITLWPFVFLLVFNCCAPVKPAKVSPVHFSAIQPASLSDYHQEFARYCQTDPTKDYEVSAVQSNFFGEHKKSVEFATLRDSRLLRSDYEVQIPGNQERVFRDHFERLANDSLATTEDRKMARRMLTLITPIDYEKTFTGDRMLNAKEAIIARASRFHFLLINEAHNSSQNRAFTIQLLKPLWEKGYRYLALEALSYEDKNLSARRYPLIESGYYLRDPVFGNMVREALALGYRLIPYETKKSTPNAAIRDRDQAQNLYNNTLKADPAGKVIIHAGYSHIAEEGSPSYSPMGAQLKAMAGQDILTVDQVTMTERNDSLKIHPYYKYVMNNLKPTDALVFKNEQDILVDPIRLTSVDMQVYHPGTVYRKGRPEWLLNNGARLYDLPAEFKKYQGFLLQAFKGGESDSAVPVDQFVIDEEKALLLTPGNYILKLTDRNGTLTGTAALQINSIR